MFNKFIDIEKFFTNKKNVIFISVLTGIFSILIWGLARISSITPFEKGRLIVYDRNQHYIGHINCKHYNYLEYKNLPQGLKNAILATEDVSFFSNIGISLASTIKFMLLYPIYKLLSIACPGGSTITQQLVRSLFLHQRKTLFRKMKELVLSVIFTLVYSKATIMEYYVNSAYFTPDVIGFGNAAMHFFNKDIHNLNINEIAVLVSMLKSPVLFSPISNKLNSFYRKNYVLYRLLITNLINMNDFQFYSKSFPILQVKIPTFNTQILRRVISEFKHNFNSNVNKTYNIKCTFDLKLQKLCEDVLRKKCNSIEERREWKGPIGKINNYKDLKNYQANYGKLVMINVNNTYTDINGKSTPLNDLDIKKYHSKLKEGSVVVVNTKGNLCNAPIITGGISVISATNMGELLASASFLDNHKIAVDFNTVQHPPCSCIKIFLLLKLLNDKHCSLNTTCYDAPGICYENKFLYVNKEFYKYLKAKNKAPYIWVPGNWDGDFLGKISVLDFFTLSRNMPFLRLTLNYIGLEELNNYFMELGIIQKRCYYPSVALGSSWDISIEDLLSKCSILYNKTISPARIIKEINGVQFTVPDKIINLDDSAIDKTLFAMKNSIPHGLAKNLSNLNYKNIYIKTGTGNNNTNFQCLILTKEYMLSFVLKGIIPTTPLAGIASSFDVMDLASELLSQLQLSDQPISPRKDNATTKHYIDDNGTIRQKAIWNDKIQDLEYTSCDSFDDIFEQLHIFDKN